MYECWHLQFSKINFNAVLTRGTCIDGPLLCGIEISVYSPVMFFLVFSCCRFFLLEFFCNCCFVGSKTGNSFLINILKKWLMVTTLVKYFGVSISERLNQLVWVVSCSTM